ncbi:conserved hypothetical protein [Uncinocarpus reesii 1704]|uniref:Mitochondrial thiamine pyrophosphate carrier 1 n=1 Tax=Uncinocarpus reesii (strain UAMH 1704) TaxID=336963 RepID=C4JL33_UNCRE|nr:uncharacterized protein UREG_00248 [Uncinocarpus reesii 1704]EEP75402.1 conserved hypothetical protein [Uncinocarpus reesii 1704]
MDDISIPSGAKNELEPKVAPTVKRKDYRGFVAGVFSGIAKLSVGHPFDTIKVRLQTTKSARFSGPVDCLLQTIRKEGVTALYKGATPPLMGWMVMDSVFDIMAFRDFTMGFPPRSSSDHSSSFGGLSAPAINFWAGGLSAQVFWITSYPSDVVKQRIMTDPLGGGLNDGERKFHRWRDAAIAVGRENGWRGYWRGFLPCFLRAFPANAMALVAFEAVMRWLP